MTLRAVLMSALAALAVPAAGAAAQELRYSDDATEACLARAETAPGDCVGRSADACMEATPGGLSTVGMGGCIDRELQYWDGRLNAAYRLAVGAAKAADREAVAGAPSREEALRVMQRSWLPYRDARCDFVRSEWGGGTGGGPAMLACLMQETAVQALFLERRAGAP